MILGIGISQIASNEEDAVLTKFAKECRIQSMTTLGNSIIDNVICSLSEQLNSMDESLNISTSNEDNFVIPNIESKMDYVFVK